MISVNEALSAVLNAVRPASVSEVVPLTLALNRVLARTLTAGEAIPPFDNSAMDGYAVRSHDTAGASVDQPVHLQLRGHLKAGAIYSGPVLPGETVRIMTGAPLPAGADAVAVQERCRQAGEEVLIEYPLQPGLNVRNRGEDIQPGDVILPAGRKIGPGETGLLASCGFAEVAVYPRPRVAVLATGDEIIDCGLPLTPGAIRNSNTPLLAALVRHHDGEPLDLGIGRDDPADLAARMGEGFRHDALVITGGASVGDHDHTRTVLEELNVGFSFESVAIRPGKPFAFGVAPSGTLVFALPGNPGAAAVIFEVFLKPALARMQNRSVQSFRLQARLTSPVKKRSGLRYYLKGRLHTDGDVPLAEPFSHQGSGVLRTFADADILIDLPEDVTELAAGDLVSIHLL